MSIARVMLLCGVAVVAFGCAARPLPAGAGITRDMTFSIVQSIRCEARDAIRVQVANLLMRPTYSAKTQNIGRAVADGTRSLEQIDITQLDIRAQDLIKKYAESAIAYGFDFTVTETNNNTSDLTLKDPLTNGGLFSFVFKSGAELERKNQRKFDIGDKFNALHISLSDEDCDFSRRTNLIYPIAGRIGMEEMIRTFLALADRGGLRISPGGDKADFLDTLTFTTRVYGTSEPKIELKPVGQGLDLTNFNGNNDNQRKDLHKLTIGLLLPKDFGRSQGFQGAPIPDKTVDRALRAIDSERARERTFEFFDTQERILERLEEDE